MQLEKFSIGVGDRFAHQAKAQLAACVCAKQRGVNIVPVWNKSNRELLIIGSAAARELGWTDSYYVDADHINLTNVQRFLEPCDFFTIDVADAIGKPPRAGAAEEFVARHPEFENREAAAGYARKYLAAVEEAGAIYRHIANRKGGGNFVTEVSMDETDTPQTPPELEVILAAIADEKIPIQTIAPKFTGRFNKGVDYRGDVAQFEKEFSDDIEVIAKAVKNYGLPANLKLSVHS